jgi:ABC-type transport system involved in multi-copper enzyme maturation permease subunit
MGQRSGLGPVFAYEWLARSRRWQAYALRGLFVLALLLGLWLVWQSSMANAYLTTRQQLVQAGESFFMTMTITQLALVLLAAPAATAGAICLDKARGTLAHVMVTDLTDREVVLGKLAARLVPVLNLIVCALPVAALGTLLGGIDPMALTAAFVIAAGVAVLGCSLALALSVWLTKAHEVMIVVFAVWSAWLLALPAWLIYQNGPGTPDWLGFSNPFWLTLAPSNYPGRTSMVEPIGFFLACLAISIGLAGWSVSRLRPVYLHQANRVPRPARNSKAAAWVRGRFQWMPGPSLDQNPVLWREWHRNRPSMVVRIVWGAYIAISSVLSLKVIWDDLTSPTGPSNEMAALLNAFQVTIGLLLVSASAGTALSEERVRGSLDVLLATPLSTRSIVWGKWWGAFRRTPWLAFWPTMVTFSLLKSTTPIWLVGLVGVVPALIIAQGAALASLGLGLATSISRTGRAVAWTISALVASVVGWPILGFLTNSVGRNGGETLMLTILMGSPFYNSAMPPVVLQQVGTGMSTAVTLGQGVWSGSILWTVGYTLIAIGLYLLILRNFDRCLGRTPERPGDPRAYPVPPRHVKSIDHLLKARVGEFDEWEVDRRLVP